MGHVFLGFRGLAAWYQDLFCLSGLSCSCWTVVSAIECLSLATTLCSLLPDLDAAGEMVFPWMFEDFASLQKLRVGSNSCPHACCTQM